MKIITLEEHMTTTAGNAAIMQNIQKEAQKDPAGMQKMMQEFQAGLIAYGFDMSLATDVAEGRIAYMDETGVDRQVLSFGDANASISPLTGAEAIKTAEGINEAMYTAVSAHPDRFSAFATLPMTEPDAAAKELERAVNELGMKGAMLLGTVAGEFLDAAKYRPVFAKAAELDVPLYLHPSIPTAQVRSSYYSEMNPVGLNAVLATPAWGWHQEAGLQMIRLILSGLFDEFPNLQMIAGHWGEFVPFFLERLDEATNPVTQAAGSLKRKFSDYYRENVYVTPSGMFTWPQMQLVLTEMGADHVLWAQDYPYVRGNEVSTFLEGASVAPIDKEKIAHSNAERLLKL